MEKDPEKPLRLEQGINWSTQYINHVTDSSSLQKKKILFLPNTSSSQWLFRFLQHRAVEKEKFIKLSSIAKDTALQPDILCQQIRSVRASVAL